MGSSRTHFPDSGGRPLVIEGREVGAIEFERLLADLSARFVGLAPDSVDE